MSRIARILHTLEEFIAPLETSYRAFFSIDEIKNQPILQWVFGGLLLFLYAIFSTWANSSNMTVETAARGAAECWPYFQECYRYFFLHALPDGYSQTTFYMGLYGIMIAIVWAMWRQKWSIAHALMLMLFVWEVLVVLVLSYQDGAPYNYYHIALMATLLLVPHKEYFLKLVFVFLYFLSVTVKIDSTWILGTYFTSLENGLPIFPDALTALFTNIVMFMQMVGCWFLLSRRVILQRLAFVYFVVFHMYSGVFVLFLYPTVTIPSLLILFGPMYRHTPIPFDKKTFGGIILLILLSVFQLLGFLAPGDRRMTLEGNRFGMFMFEANHQCVVTVTTYGERLPSIPDSETPAGTACRGFYCMVRAQTSIQGGVTAQKLRYESGSAWNRCYPYSWWSRQHTRCIYNPAVERISVQIDHSINGGPFYRIVDAQNICDLPYRAFGPNEWIKSPPEAPLVGYPVKNSYHY